jgi:tetratricopeptide (TPR) repeat protein
LYRQQSVGEAATAQSRVRLGAALCLAQRWRKARSVFAEVADGDPFPWNLEALGHLGVVAARLGEQNDAQRISQRLAVWEYPYLQGRHTYWRASIAAALGDRDDAVRFLRQAFAEGLPFTLGYDEMRHDDMNLDPLRGYPPFDRLMAPKERSNSK